MIDELKVQSETVDLVRETIEVLRSEPTYEEHLSKFREFVEAGDASKLQGIADFFAYRFEFNPSGKSYLSTSSMLESLRDSDLNVPTNRDCRLVTILFQEYLESLKADASDLMGELNVELNLTMHYTPSKFLHPYLLLKYKPSNLSERKLIKLHFISKSNTNTVAELETISIKRNSDGTENPMLVDHLQERMVLPEDLNTLSRLYDTYGYMSDEVDLELRNLSEQVEISMSMNEYNSLLQHSNANLEVIKFKYLKFLDEHGINLLGNPYFVVVLKSQIELLIDSVKATFVDEEFPEL